MSLGSLGREWKAALFESGKQESIDGRERLVFVCHGRRLGTYDRLEGPVLALGIRDRPNPHGGGGRLLGVEKTAEGAGEQHDEAR